MKVVAAWLGASVAGILVWFAAAELQGPARLFTSLLLGPLPIAALLQARAVESLPRPIQRIQLYTGTIISLWGLAVAAFLSGKVSGFTPHLMGFNSTPASTFLLWTLFGVFAGGAVVAAFKAFGLQDAEIIREMIPVTNKEKSVFVALSVSAGACEELIFRGFLIPALTIATGSLITGVGLSSLVFGVLHAHQRMGGALRAAVLGAVLALPLVLTGSIYPSMTAHAIIDIAGGLWLARWLLD